MERHEAIVAGAGPAGLAAAAMLAKRGFETIVLESSDGVGARWRRRYDGLRLNTMRTMSTLPGWRVPRSYGRYPSRDNFVTYLEDYTAHHGLDVRFGAALERVDHGDRGEWALQTSAGPLSARYAVVATGYDAVPERPEWPGQDGFSGELIHASEYHSPLPYAGRKVLIVGAGNTGIDIAGHLIDAGASVLVSMRTPPNLFPRDWLGLPLQPTAIPADFGPAKIGDALGKMIQRIIFGDLTGYGIPPSPQGFQSTFRTRRVGPAIDDGFIDALKEGRTRVVPTIEAFEGDDVILADGGREQPDVVICATGYRRGLEPIVGHLGVLAADGMPTHPNGAPANPATPRLYFAGFWASPSGQIWYMPKHAKRIARAAAKDRGR